MKCWLLLFLVGLASAASIYDVSHDIDDETAEELLVASHFADVLQSYDFELADEGEDDKESKIEKHLQDLLEKLKEAFEKGKGFKEGLLDKIKELKEKLKESKGRLSEKVKELLQKFKETVKDYVRKLLDKLGVKNQEKRFVASLREMFQKLKDILREKLDKDVLKEKVEKVFGRGSDLAEKILNYLKEKGEKGKQRILDFIDRIFPEDENREERSLAELWEKIKDFFEKVKLDIKEKYMKFGEWVRENMGKALEHLKTKQEKVKEIAKQLKEHIHDLSKEVIAEGLEFLRPYKEDLGALWDQLKESAKDILGKQD